MNKLYFVGSFLIGAATGTVAAYFLFYKKIEDQFNDQYEKDRKALEKHFEEKVDEKTINEVKKDAREHTIDYSEPDISLYKEKLDKEGYTNYSDISKPKKDYEYIISQSEAGEIPEYDLMSLRYWADGILTDDDDFDSVLDIEEYIGKDLIPNLENITDYDDPIYIRNDRMRCDLEVFIDEDDFLPDSELGDLEDEYD